LIWIKQRVFAIRFHLCMSGFVFSEAVYELILFGFVPLFLMVASVWILWHVLEKIDGVIDPRSFLAFILIIIPLVILIYGGLTVVLYNKMTAISGGSQLVSTPLEPTSRVILAGAVIYIGLRVWLWSHWRKI
jgi:hypothetical protein